MFNQNNQSNQNDKNNSIFDIVENDFFVNYMFDQPQSNQHQSFQQQLQSGLPRTASNPHITGLLNQGFQQQFAPFAQMEQQLPITNDRAYLFSDPSYQMPLLIPGKDIMKEEQSEFVLQMSQQKKLPSQPEDHMGLIKNNPELFTYKNNLKNTYINKISTLMNQDIQQNKSQKQNQKQADKLQENYQRNRSNVSQSDSDQKIEFLGKYSDEQMNAKLIRNRECARNSRKRKKVYIELLESKVKSLTDELEKTKRILQTSSSYFSQISQDTQLQTFFLGRQQIYEKLDKAIHMEKDSNEISLLLDSMRFRVGGGGKERVNAANYFFNQIMDICVPIHVRYLLWSSTNSKDLFADEPINTVILNDPIHPEQQESNTPITWSQNLIKNVNITDAQKKVIHKSKRKLIVERSKLQDLLAKFQDLKEQIYKKTSQVENFVDDLRNTLSSTQTAKFLIGLERNKYRKEMNLTKIFDIFDQNSDCEMDVKEENLNDEEQQHNSQKLF